MPIVYVITSGVSGMDDCPSCDSISYATMDEQVAKDLAETLWLGTVHEVDLLTTDDELVKQARHRRKKGV